MSRADRLAGRFDEAGIDLLLVTDLVNVRYLTGFTGSSALAVVGPGTRRFVTDFRYVEQAREQVPDFDRERAPRELLNMLADGWPAGVSRLGFEDQHVSVKQHERLRALIPDAIELVPAGGLVEAERAVKDADEVARIRAAAALADETLAAVIERGLAGRTERAVAIELEHELLLRGADKPAFDSIVASGAHGALPHAQPRDAEIPANTLVTIDWGARLDGYCSDCTRTYATGALDDDLAELYELVRRAQEAGLAAVRPGPDGRAVDAVARAVIDAGGHGEHFGHGLGHGVGLEVHEGPRLSQTGTDALQAGNVVTVEPGVYVPGRSGARIEDLVVVTEDGHAVLSSLDKALTIIG